VWLIGYGLDDRGIDVLLLARERDVLFSVTSIPVLTRTKPGIINDRAAVVKKEKLIAEAGLSSGTQRKVNVRRQNPLSNNG
jgi:hypothetical protein